MTTTTRTDPIVTREAVTWHRPLLVLAVAMAVLTVVSVIGLALDQRELIGAPLWAKPLKFSISTLIYAVTLSWLTGLLPRGRRIVWWVGTIAAVGIAIEMVIIVGAAAFGIASHFNVSTPFNTALWSVMAVSIVVVWLMTLAVGILLMRTKLGDSARAFAIRAGVAIGLIGMAVAFFMTSPNAEQLNDFQGIAGAHAVGVPDGGAGLPLLGWSTEAGDLRVPHFVGMHALQLLPLAIVLLEALSGRVRALRSPAARLGVIITLSALYLAVVTLLTVQALMGQSVVAPDAAVITTTVVLFAAAALAITFSLLRASRTESPAKQAAGATAGVTGESA